MLHDCVRVSCARSGASVIRRYVTSDHEIRGRAFGGSPALSVCVPVRP